MKKNLTTGPRTQGITLPVVMMFLLIMTIAAAFGIKRSTQNEGISRNQLDFEVSRQAAEAALRDGEADIILGATGGTGVCTRGDERPIATGLSPTTFTKECKRGQCDFGIDYYETSSYTATPVVNPQPWWPLSKGGKWNDDRVITCSSFTGGVPIGTFTGIPEIKGVAMQPEYLIENMSRGKKDSLILRITARGFGADIRTETILQSYVEIK
jgi:type IV pilus assembly protein PilX